MMHITNIVRSFQGSLKGNGGGEGLPQTKVFYETFPIMHYYPLKKTPIGRQCGKWQARKARGCDSITPETINH